MRKLNQIFSLIIISVLGACITSCGPKQQEEKSDAQSLFNQGWKGIISINLPEGNLPFELELKNNGSENIAIISNSSESLEVNRIFVSNDTLVIPGYIFESEFQLTKQGDSLVGNYVRLNTKKPYQIPCYGVKDQSYRFWSDSKNPVDISGKWEVTFWSDTGQAIGRFEQNGTDLTGTFLTPMGDYRFLEGQVNGDSFALSTFDGAHAFLFLGNVKDGKITGSFQSGNRWKEAFSGVRNEAFELPKADTLTYMVEDAEPFMYDYQDEQGNKIHVGNEDLLGEVTIVQILGTWCPNCMDETVFLVPLKNKFPDLNIVGLAFERPVDVNRAYERINKLKSLLEVNYPMYYAGPANKSVASGAFPMLNKIISFPTTIVLDKKGEVRYIHTGFTGPGTGVNYDNFSDDFHKLVNELINE